MAKQDKLKKRIKRLKRKLKQQTNLSGKAKKQVKRLNRELQARDQAIADFQRQLSGGQQAVSDPADSLLLAGTGNKKQVIEHKNAWKRHKFLCDRYDVHLESGHDKDKARILANQDLVGRHGEKAGFTAEELCDILS